MKGSTTDLNNSRPITISESLSTIYVSIFKDEIHKKIKLDKSQYGFRENGSCAHAIFTFKESCQYAKKNHIPLYVFYLDYSKAFDKVNRVKLFYKLINQLRPHIWRYIITI